MFRLWSHIILIFFALNLSAQIKQEKIYFDSDSSKIREIFHYSLVDSTLKGSYESFYLNGSLQTYGWFDQSQPDSIWVYYYENGRRKAQGRYENGVPDGQWKYFYENGNLKSKGTLKGDQKQGQWIFYYENDGEKSSGHFLDDEKVGIWNYFYEDGSIKAQTVIQDGIGTYTEFYPSGNRKMEGKNKADKSIGEWIYYYETGEVEAIGRFEGGLKTGTWKYYHKNGVVAGSGIYRQGKRQGEWKYYHDNGKISQSGKVIDDKKDGFWKLFYPSGEILGEANFDKGDGSYAEYYTSGKQKSSGNIINGKKSGKWYYYSEKGQLEGEADMKEGKGEYTGYHLDGSVKMKGTVEDDKRVGEWELYNPDGSFAGTYRPIYENEKPIFKTRISSDLRQRENLDKPEYHPEKRGLRYFLPRVNEYKGWIVGTNPLWLLDNQIPIAFEYYIQERLGYELQINILRDPFFTADSEIPLYEVYARGAKIHFRQKFYHTDTKTGMFYFGHELNFKYLNSQVSHLDTLRNPQPLLTGQLIERSYGYTVFVGNRWMKDAGSSGFTIDAFIGIGVAGRSFEKIYAPEQLSELDLRLDPYFNSRIKSSFHFPITVGLNIGFALTKSKSKTQ